MSSLSSESRITAEAFKHAFRLHPGGVAIITADTGDGPRAMTVSSLFSVSIEPPTVVFSASGASSATPTILGAATVVVHMLASDNVELAKLCATSGAARFGDGVHWDRLPTGEPYYPDAHAWLRGRVINKVDVHGSVLVVVEALEAKPPPVEAQDTETAGHDADPLVYHNRQWFTISEDSALR